MTSDLIANAPGLSVYDDENLVKLGCYDRHPALQKSIGFQSESLRLEAVFFLVFFRANPLWPCVSKALS